MKTITAVFIASFVLIYVLVPVWIRISRRRGWLDHPSEERKIHAEPVPTLGGIPLFLAILVPLLFVSFWPNIVGYELRENCGLFCGLLAGSAIILFLGIWDDLRGANSRVKFSVQIVVAVIVYFFGFKVSNLSVPFSDHVALGILSLPFTVLWIVGVTNAVNLIDGIDGLAAGVSFFALATIFGVAQIFHQPTTAALAAAAAGALLGFLRYNFFPAKIFMGDSGSMLIGFFIACIAIQGSYKSAAVVALAIPILALGVPIMDTLLAIWRRAWGRKPLFSGDRDHIHHRLIERGMSQSNAALLLYGITAFFGLLAFVYTFARSQDAALILLAFGILVVMIIQRLGYFSRNENDRKKEERRE